MGQVKAVYEELQEFKDLAKKLVDKYPEMYGDVDIDKIKCLAINNKKRPEKRKLWEVKALPEFASAYCQYTHFGVIYLDDWNEMPKKIKHRLVSAILYAVSEEEGKVKAFDHKDYTIFDKTFGLDYLNDENGPDPVEEDVKWVI